MTRRLFLVAALTLVVTGLTSAPAHATFPGPNGRIAFTDYQSNQISAVNPDGSGLVQLTHRGANRVAQNATWSPNGKRLLFVKFRLDTEDHHFRIWRMRADGSNKHQVASDAPGFVDRQPAYTPDTRHIVFDRCSPFSTCAIWKMRADGTHKQALTPYPDDANPHADELPNVSPDGERVAFTRYGADGFLARIFVMGVDGSNAHPISPPRLEANVMDWSPNGRRILFSSDVGAAQFGSNLFTMRADGTDVRRLTPDRFPYNNEEASYSPRGNRVAFGSDRNYPDLCCQDLFAINANGSGEHLIDTGLSSPVIINPAWGPAPLLP